MKRVILIVVATLVSVCVNAQNNSEWIDCGYGHQINRNVVSHTYRGTITLYFEIGRWVEESQDPNTGRYIPAREITIYRTMSHNRGLMRLGMRKVDAEGREFFSMRDTLVEYADPGSRGEKWLAMAWDTYRNNKKAYALRDGATPESKGYIEVFKEKAGTNYIDSRLGRYADTKNGHKDACWFNWLILASDADRRRYPTAKYIEYKVTLFKNDDSQLRIDSYQCLDADFEPLGCENLFNAGYGNVIQTSSNEGYRKMVDAARKLQAEGGNYFYYN